MRTAILTLLLLFGGHAMAQSSSSATAMGPNSSASASAYSSSSGECPPGTTRPDARVDSGAAPNAGTTITMGPGGTMSGTTSVGPGGPSVSIGPGGGTTTPGTGAWASTSAGCVPNPPAR